MTMGVPFTNTGTLEVQSGTLDLTRSLTNFNGTNGTLTGGTYVIAGTLRLPDANIVRNAANVVLDGAASRIVNQSSVDALRNFTTNTADGHFTLLNRQNLAATRDFDNVGNLLVGPGSTLTVNGDYRQASSGTLAVQLGDSPETGLFGRLVASGTVSLNGTLNVTLVKGFSPVEGDRFQILTFASRTGDFADINLPDLTPLRLDPQYGEDNLTLVTVPAELSPRGAHENGTSKKGHVDDRWLWPIGGSQRSDNACPSFEEPRTGLAKRSGLRPC